MTRCRCVSLLRRTHGRPFPGSAAAVWGSPVNAQEHFGFCPFYTLVRAVTPPQNASPSCLFKLPTFRAQVQFPSSLKPSLFSPPRNDLSTL